MVHYRQCRGREVIAWVEWGLVGGGSFDARGSPGRVVAAPKVGGAPAAFVESFKPGQKNIQGELELELVVTAATNH